MAMEYYDKEGALYNLDVYVNNVRNVYMLYKTLYKQVEKRIKKNKDVTLEHLEKCSSMYNIVRAAEKQIVSDGGLYITRADKRAFRHELASQIIRDARETACE